MQWLETALLRYIMVNGRPPKGIYMTIGTYGKLCMRNPEFFVPLEPPGDFMGVPIVIVDDDKIILGG